VGDYLVHFGKSVPLIHNGTDPSLRMEEGDFFAIETFGTTGKGRVGDQPDCSHYMMAPGAMGKINTLRNQSAKQLLNFINGHFKTLAWCKRWLHEWGETKYALALKQLVDSELVHPYPPLSDHAGSYVSQHEHTVAIKPTGKEIFSFGEDG
ncbi:MAG: putative methionine aminopeptidase 2B, partial [Streblomastix strix]